MKFRKVKDNMVHVQELSQHGWHAEKVGEIYLSRNQADGICHGKVLTLGKLAQQAGEPLVGETVHWRREYGIPAGGDDLLIPLDALMLVGDAQVIRMKGVE